MRQFVDDLSGFNFVKNKFQDETHIFACFDGFFICRSPKKLERFKHMEVLREATRDEIKYHCDVVKKNV